MVFRQKRDKANGAKPPAKVLVVRPTALGDVCRTVPVIAAMKMTWPNVEIDWVVRDVFAQAVTHHPAVSRVIPFARHDTKATIRMAIGLRKTKYDAAIDLQGLARSALITRASGAPDRVGFANAREGAALMYNRTHAIDAQMHTVDRMLGLMRAQWPELGEAGDAGEGTARPDRGLYLPDMRLYLCDADRRWCESVVGVDAGHRHTVIAPTAQWLCKCWPIEKYREIAERLLERDETMKIVLVAAPNEREQIKPLTDALERFGDRVVFPSTSVGQMMALIAAADMVVCNDSAPLHIAVGFDRKIVTIFGPTDPSRVGPYHRERDVLQPPGLTADDMTRYRARRDDQTLIAGLDVDTVWAAIRERIC